MAELVPLASWIVPPAQSVSIWKLPVTGINVVYEVPLLLMLMELATIPC